jgi:uncharacterized protein
MLPRQPGTKESRYMHLFSGEVPTVPVGRTLLSTDDCSQSADAESVTDRITKLEAEVAHLRAELSEVQQQLATFRKQFE